MIKNNTISKVSISDQFDIGWKRFALIRKKSSKGIIVISNYADRPNNMLIVKAGSGGYIWQYLPDRKLGDTKHDRDMLTFRLGLYQKIDQTRFIKK